VLERLRAISSDGISRRKVAISQARALRAITEIPVPIDIDALVERIPAVRLRYWRGLPHPAQLVHSATSWEIVIDPDLDPAERTIAVIHEIKHIIDLPDRRTAVPCIPGEAPAPACRAFITEMLGSNRTDPPGEPS